MTKVDRMVNVLAKWLAATCGQCPGTTGLVNCEQRNCPLTQEQFAACWIAVAAVQAHEDEEETKQAGAVPRPPALLVDEQNSNEEVHN